MCEYRFQFVMDSLMNAMECLAYQRNELAANLQDVEQKMKNVRSALQMSEKKIASLKHQRGSCTGLISVKTLNQISCRIGAWTVRYENLSRCYDTLQASHRRIVANRRYLYNEIRGLQCRLNRFEAQKHIALQRWKNEQSAADLAVDREFLEQYPFRECAV